MKILSGPYGTLLEFDDSAHHYGLDKGLASYYQSKWGSFYIVLHPQGRQILTKIAQDYVDAGVDVLITPTYRGGNHFLRDDDDVLLCNHRTQVISEDIKHIAQTAGCSLWGSIGPIGDSYTAVGSPHSIWLAYERHIGHIQALANAGVDALLFETAVKKEEIKGVIKCAEEVKLPLYVSFYVNEYGKIPEPNGACSLDTMINELDDYASSCYVQISYGINCAQKSSILSALAQNQLAQSRISFVYPNASHPTASSYTSEHRDEDCSLVDFFEEIKKLGYTLLFGGACCGYSPNDIAILKTNSSL